MTDTGAGKLFKLDSKAAILQTITIGADSRPGMPAFDGENIWSPNSAAYTTFVVRARTGAVLQSLAGNGQNSPFSVAFDGERVMITGGIGIFLSLWKAADLTPLGFVGVAPSDIVSTGVCSDGVDFWITLTSTTFPGGPGLLARF
jgi:hypothetical protein